MTEVVDAQGIADQPAAEPGLLALVDGLDVAFEDSERTGQAFRQAVFRAQTTYGQFAGGERLLCARAAHVQALRHLAAVLREAVSEVSAHPGLAGALSRAADAYDRDARLIAPGNA